MSSTKVILSIVCLGFLGACTTNPQPYPGPDKQGAGFARGAVTGAGTGAIIGAQVTSATGPGAVIGAGFGAVAGSVKGYLADEFEEEQMRLAGYAEEQRDRAYAHQMLNEHYERRIELHPTRDIFPADWFFNGDGSKLKSSAEPLVREIARLNKERLPWSRLVIAAYSKGLGEKNDYAMKLAERRSKELFNKFVAAGIEPRRIRAQGVVIDQPVLIDPHDDPSRYNQAIELIPIDR